MKAMILAAGFGTRLKPLTNNKPKALVEINGTPMLKHQILKLKAIGISDIIINVHHFADQIAEYLKQNDNFGINLELSFEKEILGTGGGILNTAHFFDDDKPFIVHNVDIISDINLIDLYNYHLINNNFVTIVVKSRETSRYFIVDQNNLVCGHLNKKDGVERIVIDPKTPTRELAFSCFHVISPEIFQHTTKTGFQSIIDIYLELIKKGFRIGAYQMDNCYWRDVGKIDDLYEVEKYFS